MTIRFLADSATYDGPTKTVRIAALDRNRLVVCAISRIAIAERLSTGPCSSARLVDLYRRHKKSFHLLAQLKYRAKRIEQDGTVLITPDDVPVLDTPTDTG